MKIAWLVKVNSGGEYMRTFTSYERAIKYYDDNVDLIEEHIEESNYDKTVTKSYGSKERVTHFKQLTKDHKYYTTLGLVSIKQIELEEQEMKKYVVVTKLIDGSRDQELLKVGKTYKVAEEYKDMLYLKGVSIYVNEGEPSYYLRADQYELVEKEETPTFKTTIDLKSAVQAKVDELRNEAEHLFKKRDRLEQQAINLDKKARKLNNLIESIKEFE